MIKISERLLTSFFVNIVLVLLGFVSAVYLGIFLNDRQTLDRELESRARAIVETIIVTRNWNAAHGGVYVRKLPGMVSNPYLANPDIRTDDGVVYTLKNPALMVREISELVGTTGVFQFHMASLKPLNPGNLPDSFEKEALTRFESGITQVSAKESRDGRILFRYMAPLHVRESCLKCHAQQRYRVGDVRGGISVRFNIDAVEAAHTRNLYIIIALAVVSFLSLAIIVYRLVHRLSQRLREAEAQLQYVAVTDELTGLRNRRYLMERLHAELKQMSRTSQPLACIMFDLDHFKRVNDTYGHGTGDQVLRSVATTARQQCREYDILSRSGGEEFVVVLPNTTLDRAAELAERLRQAISEGMITTADGRPLAVTASFGVAWLAEPMKNVDEAQVSLLKRADEALYQAKEKGRNRTECLA